MPILSLEKTTAALLEKFRRLSEYEQRKIVFWYDNDGTAGEDDLDCIRETLQKNGIKMHILKDNFFATKRILEHLDTQSNYLIYSPEQERPYEQNWLLDIQLYSERFENSRVSDLKAEIGVEGYDLDRFLEKHQKFFSSKKRVAAIKKIYEDTWKEDKFLSGIFAVLTGSSVVDTRDIVKNLLTNSLNEEENTIWEDFTRYNLTDAFWDIVSRHFGFHTEYPTLKKFFLSLVITHIDRHAELSLGPLERYVNNQRQRNECEIFISGWMDNSRDSARFDEYCNDLLLEDDKSLEKSLTSILNKARVECYLDVEAPDTVDKNIIRTIVNTLAEGGKDYCKYLEWIEKRRTKHYYRAFGDLYSALENAINLIQLSEQIESEGITQSSAHDLFRKYTDSYYLHDFYYRKFYFYYDKTSQKDILKTTLREMIERDYRRIHEKILMKWSDLIKAETNGGWGIELVGKQHDFFTDNVKTILTRNERDKVAVIISDAMRYEIASELRDVLNTSTNGLIEITAMTGSLPSYTKLGMASLLPHTNIGFKKDHIFVDGINSDGIANREKILLKYEKESLALNFKDLMNLKREDARECLKGKRVVYIYHNRIDETGDKQSSEYEVFDAADKAITEIDAMVNRLVRSLNISNIIITADHGFIYNRDSLESVDIVETTGFDKDQALITNKRFIISSEDIHLQNTHRFDLDVISDSAEKMYIYTPYADLRFRLQGGGRNFVHGGLSLQEIVIPVLIYKHNKSEADLDRKGIEHGKVGITVIDLKKVTNNPFKIRLLQTENVTDKREPLRCKIALYDNSGSRVSDEKVLIADKTSNEPNDRIFEVMLTMSAHIKNGIYILKAVNEDVKALNRDVFEMPIEVDILITDDF
ncbi:uncharacterized protein (TIGR02687 family) [Methanocalculus sp. AMF5]|uniref:BREX-1 system phosphatase PglZ type A n=1 Tax=Methanocalculus sp. AMF5 TaxID=1198257 RepID=UPI0020A1BEB9|nr:BREX-1 system phosphatase PglZ type A [Methanocalculus sp. AMF5]MCP1663285.1 uncharacterized protein (TIGR02687 family) [Methanocalculus sp. AMF5]